MRRLLLVALLSSAVLLGLGGTALAESDKCDGPDCYAPTQCSDGQDNDSNGLVDLADPGCEGNPGDQSECCYVPPPPEPPPPPPPPAPPPPACSDGVDNDWDGHTDLYDYGCGTNPYDNNEGDNDVYDSDIVWEEEYYACGTGGANANQWKETLAEVDALPCPATTSRCKLQYFVNTTTQAGLWDAVKYRAWYKVCYRHGVNIVTVLGRGGDSIFSHWPWNYKGNAEDYPHHFRYTHYVDFKYRFKVEFCLADPACTATKWPFFTVRFMDNNTQIKIEGGVG
jgi:hypothetical protein